MNWSKLENEGTIEEIKELSKDKAVVIFKHSTSCSISGMALNRLERAWNDQEMKEVTPFYLDLLAHRNISNALAEQFNVRHESPQILLIKDGNCVYNNSHMGISYPDLKNHIATLNLA